MSALLQPVQDLARGAAFAMRATLRRSALVCAALLVASLGAAFLIVAGYIGLRFLVGPGLAALIMGGALLALAAGLLFLAQSAKQITLPGTVANPKGPSATTPPQPGEAATMAVFTAAFLLGRQLADSCSRSRNS
jgi:hypothetical protein